MHFREPVLSSSAWILLSHTQKRFCDVIQNLFCVWLSKIQALELRTGSQKCTCKQANCLPLKSRVSNAPPCFQSWPETRMRSVRRKLSSFFFWPSSKILKNADSTRCRAFFGFHTTFKTPPPITKSFQSHWFKPLNFYHNLWNIRPKNTVFSFFFVGGGGEYKESP